MVLRSSEVDPQAEIREGMCVGLAGSGGRSDGQGGQVRGGWIEQEGSGRGHSSGEVGIVDVPQGLGTVTVPRWWDWSHWCLRPCPRGTTPSTQQETWSHSCLALPDQCGNMHASVRAAEAAGECDEAAEMGPGPRGGEGPRPWHGGMRPQLPRNPVWFCRQGLADKVWLGEPDPVGLEWGLLPGAAW